jgi:hypothetical protein
MRGDYALIQIWERLLRCTLVESGTLRTSDRNAQMSAFGSQADESEPFPNFLTRFPGFCI